MKTRIITVIVLFVSLQMFAQCPVQKTGTYYGFFRVTNFKEKVCWLSEPFAYEVANNQIANYDALVACFKEKVSALGGNIEHDADEFGREKVVWLNNSYSTSDELESSYNWYLPSANACLKYIRGEISYKTNVGIEVKIVKMFGTGLIDKSELNQ